MGKTQARIQAMDSAFIEHSACAVYQVIADFGSYSAWWPWVVRFRPLRLSPDYVGSRVEVRSFGVARFLYEIERTRVDREVVVRYRGSILTGNGRWSIRENGSGSTLSYEIDLLPKTWLFLQMVKLLRISRLHSRLMSRTFRGLADYLSRMGAETR